MLVAILVNIYLFEGILTRIPSFNFNNTIENASIHENSDENLERVDFDASFFNTFFVLGSEQYMKKL